LGNKVRHGGHGISLVVVTLKDVASCREGAEVTLSIAKVLKHVVPVAFGGGATGPESDILLEDGLAGKNDISKINHLLV
jgi:hypothetical protein